MIYYTKKPKSGMRRMRCVAHPRIFMPCRASPGAAVRERGVNDKKTRKEDGTLQSVKRKPRRATVCLAGVLTFPLLLKRKSISRNTGWRGRKAWFSGQNMVFERAKQSFLQPKIVNLATQDSQSCNARCSVLASDMAENEASFI